MSIEIQGLSKRFGAFKAVDNINLSLASGDLVALLGPSGSGKSTLLRMIAGLESPDEGEVRLSGREAGGLSALERNVGFVFQHYALFRHMTVEENIGFGLSVRKRPKAEIKARVEQLLGLVQLQGLGGRYPTSSPAASASASPWPGPWRPSHRSSSWTSPLGPWMPRFAPSCGAGCGACTTRPA
jgi:sulfate transport system ATP-binding protein